MAKPLSKKLNEFQERRKRGAMMIEINMKIRLDATKHPVCTECKHSVSSHGEMNGQVYCWACTAAGNKQCPYRKDT